MATVVYSNEEDDMCSLVIDGEEYVEDEESFLYTLNRSRD